MRKTKKCSESLVTKTELVLPNDTNSFDNLFGGRLMQWMDIAAAIASQKHSNHTVVTASVDNISFNAPIKEGNVVIINAFVTRAFSSSMEVYLEVTAEDVPASDKVGSNKAFFTFVALDDNGKPVEIPEVRPETDFEKELYDGALRRRQLRLVLSGRMKPNDANELKSMFYL